jgi:hypothetical protein
MKYSLRSLMIGITLICVVLGGVTGRIEYLRRWAVYHDKAAEEDSGTNVFEWNDHRFAAYQYRMAMWRPWTIVRPNMMDRKWHTERKRLADEPWYKDLPPEPPIAASVLKAKKWAAEGEKWAADVEKLRNEQSARPSSSASAPNPPNP